MTLLSVVKEATDIYATYGVTGLIVLIALTIGYFALKKVFFVRGCRNVKVY